MPLKRISSRDNPEFKHLHELARSSRVRREHGQTLLDGEHSLEEALLAGLRPGQLIFADDSPRAEIWMARLPDVPTLLLAPVLLRELSPVITPLGVMARIDIPKPSPHRDIRFCMMLEAVQDPGNLGALIRTGAAAGVDSVFLSRGCAESWSPKALRGGQGAQFRLAIQEGADLGKVAAEFDGKVYAAVPHAARSLYDMDLSGPTAFVFGNEGSGLGDTVLGVAEPFTIPMPGGMESLNVAAAAAVCLFERVRQLAACPGGST